MKVLRLLTSILSVLSIIFQRESEQWLWKMPEVFLDKLKRFDVFVVDAMADLEKHRNEIDVVCRAEQKRVFTFKPLPQLNTSSCQLVAQS